MTRLYLKVAKLLQTIVNDEATELAKRQWIYRYATEADGVWIYQDFIIWLTAKP